MNLPAAELGLLAGEQERRLAALTAAKDQACRELRLESDSMRLINREALLADNLGAARLVTVDQLRLEAGSTLTLKPTSELMLHSPAASVVLEPGAALTLERGSALIVGEPNKGLGLLTQQIDAGKLVGAGLPFEPAATLIVGEPSKGLGRLTKSIEISSKLGEVGLLFDPAAALSGIMAEQYERPLRNFMLAADSLVRPVQEAVIQFAESMQPSLDAAKLWRQTLTEQAGSLSWLAGLGEWDAVNRLYERENYPIIGLPNVAEQITGALQGWQAPAVHVAQVAKLIEVDSQTWLPEQRPDSQPPPQNGNFGIAPAQPGQRADLLALLADELQAGRIDATKVISLVAQVAKLPPLAELQAELGKLEELEQAWRKTKGRKTPDRFAKDQNMSKATLYRRWRRLKELRLLLEVWQ